MLPSKPTELPDETANTRYAANYKSFFDEPLNPDKAAIAWGAPDVVDERWARIRRRHATEVLAFLRQDNLTSMTSFCDFSAGAGYCTFAAAKNYKIVFHCDLSAASLLYACRKASFLGLENIVFLRADYFAPPFRSSCHHIVCLDTLIRGEWHEQRLLRSVRNALLPGGAAVVDFHNWWHNPLRRMGLLHENFAENRSYGASELRRLLTHTGVGDFDLRPFVQEIDADRGSARFLKWIIPATRFLVRFTSQEELAGPDVLTRSVAT